jgi:hypothetical protein
LFVLFDLAVIGIIVIKLLAGHREAEDKPGSAASFGAGLGLSPMPTDGPPAPDFTLTRVTDGSAVQLSDLYAERPVVLILASFT